uniref:Pallidipin-like lipocalin n=1 Tax=Triatoma matogrossensis TaxID=162370 RepID=E2J754_9HEMI
MKTIIAVTFLGILMCAFAENCDLKQPVANFDSEKYFSISRSFVTYSKNDQKPVCREYLTTRNTDGTTKTVYTIRDRTAPSDVEVNCINKPKSGSNGQFSVSCTLPAGNTFQLTTSVVDTDYNKYVILQSCPDSGPGDILVFQTDKNEKIPAVTNYIAQQGGQWYSRINDRC